MVAAKHRLDVLDTRESIVSAGHGQGSEDIESGCFLHFLPPTQALMLHSVHHASTLPFYGLHHGRHLADFV